MWLRSSVCLRAWLRTRATNAGFRSESEIAAQLRSAHVIPIHDYGQIDGQLYIDMRLVNGEDVADRLNRSGPMSAHVAVDVVRQTASALDAAHAMNLIHRDVKPSNILLSPEDGRDGHDFVYLVDFGIARAADRVGELTGTGGVMGTPDYMAPERFEGRHEKPEQVITLTGRPAVIVKVDATGAHTSGTCGTKGAVYAISATGFTGELGPTAILVVVAGVGFSRAIPEAEIRQILTTLRPEK